MFLVMVLLYTYIWINKSANSQEIILGKRNIKIYIINIEKKTSKLILYSFPERDCYQL